MWAGMPISESRSANQAPAVGGLEGDAGGLRLELPEHTQELVRLAGDPSAREQLSVVGENGDVRGLAVQIHSDVDHDRASFLSFVSSGRYDVML
jgi:hypothetical protein